jgi:hypothetical protein
VLFRLTVNPWRLAYLSTRCQLVADAHAVSGHVMDRTDVHKMSGPPSATFPTVSK